MEDLDHQRKKLVLILLQQIQNLCLSLHYETDNSYLFFNGNEIIKFKADNKNVIFQT